MFRLAIIAQAEWGQYWARCASMHPEWTGACAHNAHMGAMHILAMEAAS